MQTIRRNSIGIDELPDVLRRLNQEPIPAEALERRRKLSAEIRKIRDEMKPLEGDIKDVIRRQRGEEPGG